MMSPSIRTPPAERRQVAALPWRRCAGGIEILLVTSRETRRWVTPKGGRIAGRTDAQSAALEAMAATLTPQAAATLRRAVRAQQYPEVYRAMDRVDGTIDRVMSLPDLTPAQLTTLSTEADAFRARSDDIADRAVAVLTEAEASQAAMITNAGNPEKTIEKVRRNELANADLDYDRSELSARALRRMRAVLSPSQAQAAGLAER